MVSYAVVCCHSARHWHSMPPSILYYVIAVSSMGMKIRCWSSLLYVFPKVLTVLDDKARLPLACTHKDGSENERRSNTMRLLSNFQEETTRKEIADADAAGGDS